MKTVIVTLLAIALLGATAAEAAVVDIHVGGHPHRHRVCYIRHHHRVCSWR